jgi:hypothetical protein
VNAHEHWTWNMVRCCPIIGFKRNLQFQILIWLLFHRTINSSLNMFYLNVQNLWLQKLPKNLESSLGLKLI